MPSRRRITLVTDELLGLEGAGGLGTATSYLAVALSRMGHEVEALHSGGQQSAVLDAEWARVYEDNGIRVRLVPPLRESIEPPYFARLRATERALLADPPDVVITQDLAAPAYTALRSRQCGLGLEETLFVVYCHGTRRWITDAARKVRVLPGALAITVLEQASIELADIAVSPSAYMLDWMRRQGWRLPSRTVVIPLLTRSSAFGEPPPRAADTTRNGRVDRLAFFGRLEERKGVRPFVAGLNALDPALLRGVELVFIGRPWSIMPDEIEASLSSAVRSAIRSLSFETSLAQRDALGRLSQAGTVAVMPSLEDNSPATVYECLERGIPFVASRVGGTGELVAPTDRDRVLFEPTANGVESALQRVLSETDRFEPARPAFDFGAAAAQWADVVTTQATPTRASVARPTVDVIVADAQDREAKLRESDSEWVVFLDEHDEPDKDLVAALVTAQSASGADVVTCGTRVEDTEIFFLGEPGALGLLANHYGSVALIRRELLETLETPWPEGVDPAWPLLARMSMSGAAIVSLPRALIERATRPGAIATHPQDALAVAQEFEQQLPDHLRSLARIVGGFAAPPSAVAATDMRQRIRKWLSDTLRRR